MKNFNVIQSHYSVWLKIEKTKKEDWNWPRQRWLTSDRTIAQKSRAESEDFNERHASAFGVMETNF